MGRTHQSESTSSYAVQETAKQEPSLLWLVPLLVVIAIGLTWANRTYLSHSNQYTNRDFMSIWTGGKAVLKGLDPHDVDVWQPLRAQYGSSWMPDQKDPYPLWTAIVFAPLAAAFDINMAGAVWLTLSEILLGVSLSALIMYYAGVKLSALEFGAIMLSSYGSRWVTLTLGTGQMAIVLVFILTLFFVLVKQERWFWAGFSLTFIALKPNPFVIFVPMVIVWTISHRRWHLAAGGIAGAAALFGASWLLRPGWLAAWVSVRGKLDVTQQTPTVWGVAYELVGLDWWPALGLLFAVILTAAVGAVLLLNRKLTAPEMVATALPFSLLITPYAWAYEHTLLLIPLALFYCYLRAFRFAPLVYFALSFVLPWGLYVIASRRQLDTYSFLVPLIIGLAYLSTQYLDYPTSDEAAPHALRSDPNPLQSDG
jgi:hypothetical protein